MKGTAELETGAIIQEVARENAVRHTQGGHGPVMAQPVLTATRRKLAIFCYEDASSPMGQYILMTAPVLAQDMDVHLFCRGTFKFSAPGPLLDEPGVAPTVKVHAVGNSREDNIVARVQ